MIPLSRRSFLKASAFSALTQVGTSFLRPTELLALTSAQTTDYKALVCIALDGGCDGNNVLVPLDNARYGLYAHSRGALALDPSVLNPIQNGTSDYYGFHPALANTSSLYSSGQAAVLANAGPLSQLITKNDYFNNASTVPSDLMNHERQRYQWGTSYTATGATLNTYTGWGGRVADALASKNTGTFPTVTCMTPGMAEQIFCYGKTSYPAVLNPGMSAVFPSDADTSLQLLAKLRGKGALVGTAATGLKDAMDQSALLASVLSATPSFSTVFPTSALGAQLQQTLSMISAHTSLGMQRQIFLCALQGFDTHQNQIYQQQVALTDLDNCLAAFTAGLKELGLLNQVTTFTTSDFGRSLTINSSAGSDHAWGNHHLILGGAVRGNHIYGKYPDITPNSADDLGQGRWLPSTSVDQYGATLASWFGVPDSQLTTLFPNLQNFTSPKLGFI